MTTLRARIVALLLLAIVTVVGLATFAASHALRPSPPEATVEPTARQIHLLASIVERDRREAISFGVMLRSEPAPGRVFERSTAILNDALERTGPARPALVSRPDGSRVFEASIDLGADGWLVVDVPELSPPLFRWPLLATWIALIIIGSAAVSIFAASKIMGPLQLLHDAVGRIDPDGTLPRLAETGSGELRATARALNRLSARLRSAMESRIRLVAAAGHDLRTPMTRMRLRAEFIPDETERGKWFADLDELDQIADSAIRLVREEVSRDGTEIVEVDDLLRRLADELSQLGHQVALLPSPPARVMAGPLALKRAFGNLVINAATHGGGATIALSRAGDEAVVTITDEGPGIPEHLIGQVFEPFFRADISRRKSVRGAGLGLAIAREIMQRFDGTIAIRNRKPQGLIQTVTLPTAKQA